MTTKKGLTGLLAGLTLLASTTPAFADKNPLSGPTDIAYTIATTHETNPDPICPPGTPGIETPYHTLDSGLLPEGSGNLQDFGDMMQLANPLVAWSKANSEANHEGKSQWFFYNLAVTAVTQGLKVGINAKRPDGSDYSFPSGHTSAAFSGPAFIHMRYGFQESLPYLLAATLTGVSRATEEEKFDDHCRFDMHPDSYTDEPAHHWRDVFAGAALSYGLAYLMVDSTSIDPGFDPYAEVEMFGGTLELAPYITAGGGGFIGEFHMDGELEDLMFSASASKKKFELTFGLEF